MLTYDCVTCGFLKPFSCLGKASSSWIGFPPYGHCVSCCSVFKFRDFPGFCKRNFVLPKSPQENRVGSTCRHLFRRQLLDQLGKRFLGPTSGRRGHNSKRKKRFQKGNNASDLEIMTLRGRRRFCPFEAQISAARSF